MTDRDDDEAQRLADEILRRAKDADDAEPRPFDATAVMMAAGIERSTYDNWRERVFGTLGYSKRWKHRRYSYIDLRMFVITADLVRLGISVAHAARVASNLRGIGDNNLVIVPPLQQQGGGPIHLWPDVRIVRPDTRLYDIFAGEQAVVVIDLRRVRARIAATLGVEGA